MTVEITDVKEVFRSRYSVYYSALVNGTEVRVGGCAEWTKAQFVDYLKANASLANAWTEVLSTDNFISQAFKARNQV